MLGRLGLRRGVTLLFLSLSGACSWGGAVRHSPNSVEASSRVAQSFEARTAHDKPGAPGLTPAPAAPSAASPDQWVVQADALTPEETALRDFVVTSFRGEHLEVSPCHRFARLDHRRLRERRGASDESLRAAERLEESLRAAGRVDSEYLTLIQWLADQYGNRTLEARRGLAAAFALERRPSVSEQRRLVAALREYQSKALDYLARGCQRESRRWQENAYVLGLHHYYAGQPAEARRAWLALLNSKDAPHRGRWLNLYSHVALGQSYLVKPVTDESRRLALVHFREAYSVLSSSDVFRPTVAAAGCYVAELESASGRDKKALAVLRKLVAIPAGESGGVSAYAKKRVEELRSGRGDGADE